MCKKYADWLICCSNPEQGAAEGQQQLQQCDGMDLVKKTYSASVLQSVCQMTLSQPLSQVHKAQKSLLKMSTKRSVL